MKDSLLDKRYDMRDNEHASKCWTLAVFLTIVSLSTLQAQERSTRIQLPLFSWDSAWNQRADSTAVLSESETQILLLYRVLLGDKTDLIPSEGMADPWPFIVVNYEEFTIPIGIAGSGTQSVLLREYEGAVGSTTPMIPESGGRVTFPTTMGPVRPSNPQGIDSDGHLAIYDPISLHTWEIWQATTAVDSQGNSLGGGYIGTSIVQAGAVDKFDLTKDGMNLPTWSSARATGTPLLAGLLIPEDVESGAIRHALALAIPGLRNLSSDQYEPLASDYFPPTTTTETDFINTNRQSLAAGQRLRLKKTVVDGEGRAVDESQLAPITRMFLAALRDYGLYIVDNSGGFICYAEDIHSANLDLTDDEVNALIGSQPGTSLPAGKSKWEIVLNRLDEDLLEIPIASGPWDEYGPGGKDPSTAFFGISNFEVVENYERPTLTRRRPVRRK